MLRNLKAEMIRREVSAKQIAELLQVRLTTVYDKLNGKYPFTFDEALAIKKTFFPKDSLESLFESEKQIKRLESEVNEDVFCKN